VSSETPHSRPSTPAAAPGSLVAEATAMADDAAAAAGVVTRPARPDELGGVLARFEATWGAGRSPDRSMLQALEHAGNTLLVAVELQANRVDVTAAADTKAADTTAADAGATAASPDAATVPLGATLGFLGWNGGLHLHSHMNAVDPGARGRGIGVALKLRQRALCLAHGVTEMRWTYDPLIRRNAHLNLVRLGAEVVSFLPDFYGRLDDAITGTDRSDRFEVRWRLDSPRTSRALARGPVPGWHREGGLALVADFERVRAEDPETAARLRDASREAFAAFAPIAGREPGASSALRVDLDANGDYVFTRDDPDTEA
jgi:predicted GNAT superfamily acetyltransferase